MAELYLLEKEKVLEVFKVEIEKGLTAEQVETRQKKYGKNELPREQGSSLLEKIWEQFQDKLVVILLIAAVISFVLAFFEEEHLSITAFVEPIVILLILIANATIGVVQENNAEHAIESLLEYSPDEAVVVRAGENGEEGEEKKINAVELVPGDIVKLSVGDKVPADCRVLDIETSMLRIEQSILTGESDSVYKTTEAVDIKNAVLQEQKNMIFAGTTVVNGRATCVVCQTGLDTALGNIHESMAKVEQEQTPLERKLDDFGDMLAKIITIICILVWVINIRHFGEESHHGWMRGAVYYFKIAVALAVAAIPEGLSVVITTCLALGTQKMAKKNAIVRTLPSVETLGCTSVICSDKTGTLTTNMMSVEYVLTSNSKGGFEELQLTGTSYEAEGKILVEGGSVEEETPADSNRVIEEVSKVSTLCNMAKLVYEKEEENENMNMNMNMGNRGEKDNLVLKRMGEPTEAALKTLAEKLGTRSIEFNDKLKEMERGKRVSACSEWYFKEYKRVAVHEFTRSRKSMSVVVVDKNGRKQLLVKGAPESILERCKYIRQNDSGNQSSTVEMTEMQRKRINEKVEEYGNERSLRTLGLAVVDNLVSDSKEGAELEQEMVFIGLVAMRDPPRPEVRAAVEECYAAGIRVIVITGDNPKTAESICRAIGVFDNSEEDMSKMSYTGRQLEKLSRSEQLSVVQTARLFSRTEPAHKQLLVELLQELGHIVAMTGDGVNDAPALKKSNIGIAMGSGTDVAKMASDMVLADDNFATIAMAVSEGRAIYNNTKQFIRYLISSNIGEVVSIFLTVLLNLPEALAPVQLLWVNLVTDGLPATALGFNPLDHLAMRRPPRNSREPLVSNWLLTRYLIVGFYVGFATVFAYIYYYLYDPSGPQVSFYELSHFHSCSSRDVVADCSIYTNFHATIASTMSLSVLVVIEMFNAANSLSENESLLTLPIFSNMYLVGAIALSMLLHFAIVYLPMFQPVFMVTALSFDQWVAVVLLSLPVIFIDEILKFVTRNYIETGTAHCPTKYFLSHHPDSLGGDPSKLKSD